MKKRYWLAILCAALALTAMTLLPSLWHTASAEDTYTITWMNDDGTQLAVTEVAEGETPIYPGETPTKEMDTAYIYTFYGWDPEPIPAVADATYTAVYSAAERQDRCGESLNWSFDNTTGTLTITGSGDMYDFYYHDSVPWYSFRSSIKEVLLPDGLTSISNYAFYECWSLREITIPDSVTDICQRAFYNCSSLKTITIPDSVTNLEWYVFYGCRGLESVTIGDGIKNIREYTFCNCTKLNSVSIGNQIGYVREKAFTIQLW